MGVLILDAMDKTAIGQAAKDSGVSMAA